MAEHIEVAVSDGSDDGATGDVVERVLTGWPAGYRYVWNRPALSLVENMNRAVEISTGQWVVQLHDDDYLLPGAGAAMLDAIRRAAPGESVLLFGVHIVDIDGVRRREQTFRRERYLEPREALRRLLRNSSFVREPTAVVRRAAIDQEGLFDTTVGGATDTDMWVRLFSHYGVRCLPQATCAYTIHEAAATTGMWNPGTIRANGEIFDRAVARGIVPERTIRRWQADWYHQFILAGAYRRLRIGTAGRGPRGAAAVRAAGRPRPGRVAEVAARAGRVHGRHGGGAPQGGENSVMDPQTEPPFNDRWQGESDAIGGDRLGIVASLLRYREIVVAATLLGALAGYGLAQQTPVRYQADAVLILSDPGGPSVLGGGDALESSIREVYLAKQAEIMTSSVVLERALELLGSCQSPPDVRGELNVQPSANMASISIVATSADPRSAAALANAVGTAYEQVTEERAAAEAQRAIASLEKLRNRFQANLDASPESPDGQLSSHQQQLAGQIADIEQREQDITAQAEVYASGVEYFESGRTARLPIAAQAQASGGAGRVAGPARGGGVGVVGGSTRPARRGPGRTGPDPRSAAARRGATATRPAEGDGQTGHPAEARPGPRGRLSPRRRLDGARAGRSRRKLDRRDERRAGRQQNLHRAEHR